jgi:hypothetical protein
MKKEKKAAPAPRRKPFVAPKVESKDSLKKVTAVISEQPN